MFAHLHVHSHYSLLDGTARVEDLVRAAREAEVPALALTDHGNLFGAVDFWREAKAAGLRPILGMEAYVARTDRRRRSDGADNPTDHLTLLALDDEGYRNLVRLSSLAFLEGFFKKPRIDKESLAAHARGLVALSGCLSGEVPRALLSGDERGARETAGTYAELLGRDRYFLEVMRGDLPEQERVIEGLSRLARATGLPLVATNDVHYLRPEDAEAQDVLVCIQTGKTLLDEKRLRIETDRLYLRTPREMEELFRDLPDAVAVSGAIAERATLELALGRPLLPAFDPGTGESAEQAFERLCREGFARRYEGAPARALQRLARETETIRSTGFVHYFLIVEDLVRFARGAGVAVGPGRGSAAGSIVAYCLGITDVDPLRYDLLFERFLNPERISMPDIDIDFAAAGRERVLAYLRERYGEANVSQIVTFTTMASRAVVRDVGRTLGLPLGEVDRIAKRIPAGPGASLRDALANDADLRELGATDPRLRRLFETATKLEGLARNASVHAAGVVIADRPLVEIVPLYRKDEATTTQYSMTALEEVGLLKMDLLGLKTLDILEACARLADESRGARLDYATTPLDDAATFALLSAADTLGVFQVESEGMRKLLARLRPDRFEDLIALLALYRPGPLGAGMADAYVRRKWGEEKVEFPHPSLEEVLRDTYGVLVYQEQVMRIAERLAGFTLPEADNLRKAIGKKKPEILERFRSKFLEGAVARGAPRRTAESVWDSVEYFGGYGFNRSHSTAYAFLTYRTAYAKANFRREFLCANLTVEAGNAEKVRAFVEDARRAGIAVLPPDLNRSNLAFRVEGDAIRFGLAAIKGLGERAAEELLAGRAREGGAFQGLDRLCASTDGRVVNRAVLEALGKSGALDFASRDRGATLGAIPTAIAAAAGERSDRAAGQGRLFEGSARTAAPRAEGSRAWTEEERLAGEREALGFYLTGHPLARHRGALRLLARHTTADLARLEDGAEAELAGRILDLRVAVVKQGPRAGERMARFVLEDLSGSSPVVVFPEAYSRLRDRLAAEAIARLRGRADRTGETPGLRLRDLDRLEDLLGDGEGSGVIIRLEAGEVALMPRLREAVEGHRGPRSLYFEIREPGGGTRRVRAGERFRVEADEGFLARVEGLLGPGRVGLAPLGRPGPGP